MSRLVRRINYLSRWNNVRINRLDIMGWTNVVIEGPLDGRWRHFRFRFLLHLHFRFSFRKLSADGNAVFAVAVDVVVEQSRKDVSIDDFVII
jgi:hypothetical protein